ncbi:hypothetical protein BJX61DRAFT_501101 [Aspergillus egyptiacus]|nr:hypothetical protein BJX61DRAFT_501101 [Aspergillus egyptiacus]
MSLMRYPISRSSFNLRKKPFPLPRLGTVLPQTKPIDEERHPHYKSERLLRDRRSGRQASMHCV